jgi:hypothetical protein
MTKITENKKSKYGEFAIFKMKKIGISDFLENKMELS